MTFLSPEQCYTVVIVYKGGFYTVFVKYKTSMEFAEWLCAEFGFVTPVISSEYVEDLDEMEAIVELNANMGVSSQIKVCE